MSAERLLGALPAEDRAAVERFSRRLGFGRDGWSRVPPFRSLVEVLAIVTIADRLREEDPELSDSAAFQRAAELVGFEDDPERATHPAETPARRLRDWLGRAWATDRGENLQPRKSA